MRTLTQYIPWNAVVNNAASKARHIIGLFTPNLTMEVLVVDYAQYPSAHYVTRILLDYIPTLNNGPYLSRIISQAL